MRLIIRQHIFTITLIILTSCNHSKESNYYDDSDRALCNCIEEKFDSSGIDIRSFLYQTKPLLQYSGVIPTFSKPGYVTFMHNIRDSFLLNGNYPTLPVSIVDNKDTKFIVEHGLSLINTCNLKYQSESEKIFLAQFEDHNYNIDNWIKYFESNYPEEQANSIGNQYRFIILAITISENQHYYFEKSQPEELPKPNFESGEIIGLPPHAFFEILLNKSNNILVDQNFHIPRDSIRNLRYVFENFYSNHTGEYKCSEFCDEETYPKRYLTVKSELKSDIEKWLASFKEWPSDEDTSYPKRMLQKAQGNLRVYEMMGKYYVMPLVSIINLKTHPKTSYGFYLEVLDLHNQVLDSLRNTFCQEKWDVNLNELDLVFDADKLLIVETLYPAKLVDKSGQ